MQFLYYTSNFLNFLFTCHTYRLFVEIMILLVAGLFHVCVPCSEEQDSESLNIMTMNIV